MKNCRGKWWVFGFTTFYRPPRPRSPLCTRAGALTVQNCGSKVVKGGGTPLMVACWEKGTMDYGTIGSRSFCSSTTRKSTRAHPAQTPERHKPLTAARLKRERDKHRVTRHLHARHVAVLQAQRHRGKARYRGGRVQVEVRSEGKACASGSAAATTDPPTTDAAAPPARQLITTRRLTQTNWGPFSSHPAQLEVDRPSAARDRID